MYISYFNCIFGNNRLYLKLGEVANIMYLYKERIFNYVRKGFYKA